MPQKAFPVALPLAWKAGIPALSERAPDSLAWALGCTEHLGPTMTGADVAIPGLLASAQVPSCCGPGAAQCQAWGSRRWLGREPRSPAPPFV